MRLRGIGLAVGLLLAVSGCAFLKRHIGNVQAGIQTPQTAEEAAVGAPSVWAQGRQAAEPVKELPYGGIVFTPLALLLGLWYADRRGAKLMAAKGVTAQPASGFAAKWGIGPLNIENTVQTLANVTHGVFEVGPDNSGWKRAWKVGVAVVTGLVSTAITMPTVRDFLVSHPQAVAAFVAVSAALAGVEKELSKVLPTSPPPAG